MVKVLFVSFEKCFGSFTILLVEGSSETGLFRLYLTTYFEVRKIKNPSAMRVIFVLKMFKFKLNLENAKRKCRKTFSFLR